MKNKPFFAAALAAFLAMAVFSCGARAAQQPEYVEGEAIVVMKGASSSLSDAKSAAARESMKARAAASASKSGGSVIQLFSPIGESVSGAAPARASSASGGTLIVAHLRAAEGESTEDFIARLTKDPDVVSAMPNYLMRRQALKTPNDPLWARQWGPRAAKAPEVWRHGTGTAETVVAVIDSGVIYDHPDLKDDMFVISKELADKMNTESGVISGDFAGSHGAWYHSEVHLGMSDPHPAIPIGPSPTIPGELWDIDNGTRETMSRIGDITGHGTHVAGIIGAAGNNETGIAGMNWNVKILPVNVFSYSILGDTAETSDLIRGIDFVLAAKRAGANIRVVNMSFGMWGLPKEMEGSAYDLKIKEMSDNGMLLALAAGNDGEDLDAPKKSWLTKGRRFYPACFKYENTISVGALKKEENGALSPDGSYTNYSASGKWVDIFAPGTDILSTCRTSKLIGKIFDESGYTSISGTSMAAPCVAGAAALLFSLDPSKSAREVKAMLLEGADGSIAKEGYSAYGALDLNGAWEKGFGGTPVTPVSPDIETSGDILPLLAELPSDISQVAGIFADGQLVSTDGGLYLDFDIVDKALEGLGGREIEEISLLPVFTLADGEMTEGRLCAAAFELDGSDLAAGGTRADLAVFKIKPDGTRLEYKWAANESEYADGRYTILDEDGNVFNGSFDDAAKYTIVLFIKDNGTFDLDGNAGRIVDPTAIAVLKKENSGSGGSGGCAAAGGAASLLAVLIFAVPIVLRRKKESLAK